MRTVKVAGIQVESRNRDPEGNLRRAEPPVAAAAKRGAALVLCPEFLATGYTYHSSLWDVAEPRGGPTELWLADMARQHRISIGASYLEADGDDFFNTFSLMSPDGTIAGRTRKESLPGFEGWYFRSCSGPKLIETEFGRIGIGICHDNRTSRFLRRMVQERIDLLLMPHSAPNFSLGPLTLLGGHGPLLRRLAGFYARALGVPTVLANKASGEDTRSPVPCVPLLRLQLHNVGHSTICDADGTVCDQLDELPGIVFSEIVLDPDRPRPLPTVPAGYWAYPPRSFRRTSAALFQLLESTGKAAFSLSPSRRRAARNARARRGSTSSAEPD